MTNQNLVLVYVEVIVVITQFFVLMYELSFISPYDFIYQFQLSSYLLDF